MTAIEKYRDSVLRILEEVVAPNRLEPVIRDAIMAIDTSEFAKMEADHSFNSEVLAELREVNENLLELQTAVRQS